MEQQTGGFTGRRRIEPYWYVIAVIVVILTAVFANHLVTGRTPSRIAIQIEIFDFNVFWYGIFIVGGIALGSWVTARLAMERARDDFVEHVPAVIREQPLSNLKLPKEIQHSLQKRKVNNLGDLLFEWGLNPDRLSLNKKGRQKVRGQLERVPEIDELWLDDAPWRQWNPDYVWGGVAWVLVLAVIGARLYHVLTPSPSMAAVGINSAMDYFRNPMQLINLRSGGLGIYGAIIGGFLGLLLYTRRQHISVIAWADLAVVGMALGQAVGRWGNFFNQELYGRPSDLPWAIYIDPVYRLDAYVDASKYHPAFLYASLWSLLTFVILLILARRYRDRLQTGDLMALYLVLFAVGRIMLELVRLDSRNVSLGGVDLGIPVATLVSSLIALPMAGVLIYRHVIAKDRS